MRNASNAQQGLINRLSRIEGQVRCPLLRRRPKHWLGADLGAALQRHHSAR